MLTVFWTTDRARLLRTESKSWLSTPSTTEVASPATPRERLIGLDVLTGETATSWLVAVTEKGRVLLAAWDVRLDELGTWRDVSPSTSVRAAGIGMLVAGPSVVAATPSGHLLTLDVRRAVAGDPVWHSAVRPADGPAPAPVHALAVASGGDLAALTVACDEGAWWARLSRGDDLTEVGTPTRL